MTINKQSASYKIAHTMYLSLGGDPEKEFTSVEEIYQDIDQLLGESGDRVNVEPLQVELTENGTTVFNDVNITGYKPVEVSVNVDFGDVYDDGYNTGVADQKSKLKSISITENGTYNREDGYNEVTVNVQGKLEVPFEEIGYPSELKNELNDGLNSKPWSDFEYSKSLYDAWNPNITLATGKYSGDTKLVYAPNINTSNITIMNYMFKNCSKLTIVPLFNTSKVTHMNYMFQNCSSLTTIPLFDTSKVTHMNDIFNGCTSLTTIPLLNTSKVTTMNYMFRDCPSLTTLPLFDTSKITNMNHMFYGCSSLTAIPSFNTSKVTSMSSTFENCSSLTVISLLDCGNVTNVGYIFGFSELKKLTDLGGFKNLGATSSVSGTSTNYFLAKAPNLTHDSLMNVINNLYDRATAGYSVLTLKLHANHLAMLTNEEKAIATNKGWILS